MENTTVWPDGFMDIGGKTFEWVFINRAEFVDFTLTEMKSPTKMFLRWKNYCLLKSKPNDRTPTEHHNEKSGESRKS